MDGAPQKHKPSLVAAVLLLLVGIAAWRLIFGHLQPALFGFGSLGPAWLGVFVLICMAAAVIPPVGGPLERLFNRLRRVGPLVRFICTLAVTGVTCGYLLLTALTEHRQLFPYIHDEFSYLIQAHQFATGHLWLPAHPLGKFFDSFQLLVTPVYASAYFPGTALLLVPGIWLHLPAFVTALAVSGVVAGLLFWIIAELVDPVAAGLAVLLLLSDGVYRQVSVLALGQMPLLLYGLLATLAWLRWRTMNKAGVRLAWIFLVGFFLGLAAVTRPVDSLCFALPIGTAVLFRHPKHFAVLVAGAVPLLCLQLTIDHGVTGDWLRTPFGMYADRDYPGTGYGFHAMDPNARPVSELPQKQALYREYLPLIREHRPLNILSDLLVPHGPFDGARLRLILSQYSPAPFPMLLPLMPLVMLGLTRARAVVLWSLPLFVLLYVPYVFFFPHYVLAIAPAVIIAILLGAKTLTQAMRSPAGHRFADVGLVLLIAGTAVAALPQWSGGNEDVFQADLLRTVNQKLAELPYMPAVVLFKYDPARNTHEEPVYNVDVGWPDDAKIIRAHDLGAQNRKIFDYYARLRSGRFVYRFDEKNRSLEYLGQVKDLTKDPPPKESKAADGSPK